MIIDHNFQATGMDIRTWLAGIALQGLLTQHQSAECESGARDLDPVYRGSDIDQLIKRAVYTADALIAELNKAKEE